MSTRAEAANLNCPMCGASVAGETEMACPKCKSLALIQVDLGETKVCECTGCHGLWVDATTFDTICTDRERQSVVLGSASEMFRSGERSIEMKVQNDPISATWTFGERDLFASAGSLFDSLRRDD